MPTVNRARQPGRDGSYTPQMFREDLKQIKAGRFIRITSYITLLAAAVAGSIWQDRREGVPPAAEIAAWEEQNTALFIFALGAGVVGFGGLLVGVRIARLAEPIARPISKLEELPERFVLYLREPPKSGAAVSRIGELLWGAPTALYDKRVGEREREQEAILAYDLEECGWDLVCLTLPRLRSRLDTITWVAVAEQKWPTVAASLMKKAALVVVRPGPKGRETEIAIGEVREKRLAAGKLAFWIPNGLKEFTAFHDSAEQPLKIARGDTLEKAGLEAALPMPGFAMDERAAAALGEVFSRHKWIRLREAQTGGIDVELSRSSPIQALTDNT